MNRWNLPVATLAAFSLLSLTAVAQTTQDNKSTSGDQAKQPVATADANQTAASQDTSTDASKPMTDAEKKAAAKEAKKKAAADKPKSDDAKKKDPDSIGDRDIGKGVNFYSLDREIALGKQLAQEVEREAKVIDDPIIAEYVNRVGQNLVRNSDAKVPFTIKVLDTEEVNAFALPGGFFFVN